MFEKTHKSVKITIILCNVVSFRSSELIRPLYTILYIYIQSESFNYRHIAIKRVKGSLSNFPPSFASTNIHAYLLSNTPLRFNLIAINPRFMNIYCNSGDCLEEDIFPWLHGSLVRTNFAFNTANNVNSLRDTPKRQGHQQLNPGWIS